MPRGKELVSADEWRDRVRRWKESGLSSREFAKQEGIGRPQALSYWAYQLKRRSTKAELSTAPVLRVVRLEPETPGPDQGVEIVTASGARVVVHASTDERALAVALRALGASS